MGWDLSVAPQQHAAVGGTVFDLAAADAGEEQPDETRLDLADALSCHHEACVLVRMRRRRVGGAEPSQEAALGSHRARWGIERSSARKRKFSDLGGNARLGRS